MSIPSPAMARIILMVAGLANAPVVAAAAPSTAADPGSATLSVERSSFLVDYQSDGTGTKDLALVANVLNDAGLRKMSVLSFPYDTDFEDIALEYVRVRKADGTTVVTPVENAQDVTPTNPSAPVYSGLHEKHLAVKSLAVGDTLEFHVRWKIRQPPVPGHCFANFYLPTEEIVKERIDQVTLPEGRGYVIESGDCKPVVTASGGRLTLRWTRANPNAQMPPARAPWLGQPAPQILFTTMKTWDELGTWYRALERPQETVTPAIQAKAKELTAGLANDKERVQALYHFVAAKIHYVGLSFGVGRFQPHAAAEVLANGFGDCKDKHALLAALLKAVGIEAWPALMRASGEINPAVPSPYQFDHLVTVVPLGPTRLWLDATPEVGPFGFLARNLRGRPALVIPARGPAHLEQTPAGMPIPNETRFTFQGRLGQDGRLQGHCDLALRGDMELGFRMLFKQMPQSRWQEFVAKGAAPIGLGFDIDGIRPGAPDKTDAPFHLTYELARPSDSDWRQHRLLVPLPSAGLDQIVKSSARSGDPYFLPAPDFTFATRAAIDVPEGTRLQLPAPLHVSSRFGEYRASYDFSQGVLTVERRLDLRRSEIPPADHKAFQDFANAVNQDEGRYLDLGGGHSDDLGKESPDTIDLFNRGVEAQERKDWAASRLAFQEVLERSPSFPGAHFGRAVASMMANDTASAVRDLLKEEELQPDKPGAYLLLGRIYLWQGRKADGIAQLKLAVSKAPDDREPFDNLLEVLHREKRYHEAREILEQRVARDSGNPEDLLALGLDQARTGQSDKAEASLTKAVALKDGPEAKIHGAAALLEAGRNPHLARTWAQEGASALDQASRTLEEPSQGLANTQLMGEAWVVLGRLLVQEGQPREAIRYLKAAWNLQHSGASGVALAQAYEGLGRKKEAVETYELAAVASPAEAAAIGSRYRKLTGQTLLNGAGRFFVHGKPVPSPADRLIEARTHHFTCGPGRGVVAAILVVGPDGVEDVSAPDASDAERGLAASVKGERLPVEWPDAAPRRVFLKGGFQFGGGKAVFVATAE